MRSRHLLAGLVVAAALTTAAHPVAAQATPAGAPSASAPSHWDAHPVGKFALSINTPDGVLPASLTIADSSGTTVATIWPEGDQEAHAFTVTNKGTELVLRADSPQGAIEVVLERRGDHITGTWKRGEDSGTLEGKPAQS